MKFSDALSGYVVCRQGWFTS